jgi:single-stranded-DNA-specific exonuclease
MDTPMKALHWLLANESRVDDWLSEVESLNAKRQEMVKEFSEDALLLADATKPILFYLHEKLEHGIIGLIAGKLTEAYHRPAIALCEHEENYVASCRSPEWCNLVELLDHSKEYFLRYGGHRQAAGFTIEKKLFPKFQEHIEQKFHEKYGNIESLPPKNLLVECSLFPHEVSQDTITLLDSFRPFGIGNPKPKFYIDNLTVTRIDRIGQEKNHLSLSFSELPGIKCLLWNFSEILKNPLYP